MREATYLRQKAARLRSRAPSARDDGMREQLLALADYYEDMATDIEQPATASPAVAS